MRASTILFFFIFFAHCVNGQNEKIDSLRSSLMQTSDKATIANLHIQLAKTFKEISVDSSLAHYELSSRYFDTTQLSQTRAEYYYHLAELYFEIGQHEKTLQKLDKVLGENQIVAGNITLDDIYTRKAQAYLRTGRFEQASDLLHLALPNLEKSENKPALASCYSGLGTVMQYGQRLDLALEYYQKAYSTNLEINELHNAYGGLANIATIHSRNKDFQLSKPAFKKIIAYCRGKNEAHLEALATGNLGMNFRDQNVQDSAEYYISKALDIYKSLNNKRGISKTSSMLSGVLQAQGKYRETIDLILPQYYIAEEQNNLRLQDNMAKRLGEVYQSLGNYKESNFFIEKHASLRDSLYKKEVSEAVNDAQTKYETEKKEAEIARLALEDQLNQERITKQQLALGGSVVGLGLLSFLLFRMNGQKKKIESQSSVIEKSLHEKETLLREIHHRVKNNLQIISSLLGLQSRSLEDKVAIDALTQSRARVQSMSLIHQNLYQRDNLTGIHVKEYFEKLSDNLINTYSLSEKIVITSEIEEILLDVDTIIPIGLILNELLTNSLKYAFPKGVGTIMVGLNKTGEQLFLTVSDDGLGIKNPKDVLNGEGYGYELVTSLVEKLEGTINVTSEKGTQVNMSFSNFEILDS